MTDRKPFSRQRTILVVDDLDPQRDLILTCLREWGWHAVGSADGKRACELLESTPVDMVISDVRMPGMSGLELVHAVRERFPTIPILLITAYPDIRQAVEAVKDGALDYLTKPIDLDELHDLVSNALGMCPERVADLPPLPEGVVFADPIMHRLLEEIHLVADSNAAVLLRGESGAGKEIVADLVHRWSPRATRPFIKLNCAAIPENMLESEIFGHEKGAFTGAASAREGRWRAADGGTLLLDEIAEMPPALQAKLLRALQDGSCSPLGSDRTYTADVRVIAASNRDIEEEVQNGRFREDLYYRLNVVEIYMPPLRERSLDILPLARRFAHEFMGRSARIGAATEQVLEKYPWPGNVRELRNVIERACLMARGDILLPNHLPARVLRAVAPPPDNPASGTSAAGNATLADTEKRTVLAALARNNGNRTRTAAELGISRRTLIYKLKAWGVR